MPDVLARISLLAVPFAAGLACSPRLTLEQFELPKHVALCLLLPGLLAGGAAGLAPRGRALLALLAVIVAAALRSPQPVPAWLGGYENLDGVLTWGLYAGCFLAGAAAAPAERRAFTAAVLGAAALAAAYGLAQAAGLDPFPGEVFRHVRAFAGNPDFLAEQMAMALPVAGAAALAGGPAGVGAVALAAALALVLGLTASRGGAVAALAGLATAILLARRQRVPRPRAVAAGAAVLVAALAAAEFALPADLTLRARVAALIAPDGFAHARGRLWTGAFRAAAERPGLGWGPETLPAVFLRTAPAGWADAEGLGMTARHAHAWPLELVVTGGVAALAAFGWLLCGAVRDRHDLEPAHAGLLVAFLVHNLVSFGTAATAPVWWVVLGMAAVGPRPGDEAAWSARAAALPAVLVAAFAAVRLTADGWAYRGNEWTRAGRPGPAVPAFATAVRLAPWEPVYATRLGGALEAVGRPDAALPVYERAAVLAPLDGLRAGHVGRIRFALATRDRQRAGQEAAYADLLAAVAMAPSQPSLYGAALMAAQALGRRDEVARLAAALRAREPGWAARMLGPSSP